MYHDLDRAATLTSAWIIFLLCCVSPVLWMLVGTTGSGIAEAMAILWSARQSELLLRTLSLGAGAALCAAAVGLPLGVVLGRCDPSRVRVARFALVVPLILPPYVLALAWTVLAERLLGSWTYSLPAAAAVLGFALFPIVMLGAEAAMRSMSARLEEAGRLVAPARQVWLKILLPLMMAAIAASTLVVFVLSISDFSVPSMLRVRVYTTEVYTAFAALYEFRLATLLAAPLAVIASVASVLALELVRRPSAGRVDRGQIGPRWPPSRQRLAALLLMVAAALVTFTPVGAVAIEARRGRVAFADAASVDAISNGLWWSLTSATLVVVVGALLGYWRTKAGAARAHLADVSWIALFAIPATVAGIGIIGLWNRPGLLGELYRSGVVVVLAYVTRFLPIAALLCAAFLRRAPPGLEEAAIVSGARWRRVFIRIVIPAARSGVVGVWLAMFILMSGDVALTILVAPPGESNLAVRAYTLMANSPVGDVARIALVQIALSVLPLVAFALLVPRRLDTA